MSNEKKPYSLHLPLYKKINDASVCEIDWSSYIFSAEAVLAETMIPENCSGGFADHWECEIFLASEYLERGSRNECIPMDELISISTTSQANIDAIDLMKHKDEYDNILDLYLIMDCSVIVGYALIHERFNKYGGRYIPDSNIEEGLIDMLMKDADECDDVCNILYGDYDNYPLWIRNCRVNSIRVALGNDSGIIVFLDNNEQTQLSFSSLTGVERLSIFVYYNNIKASYFELSPEQEQAFNEFCAAAYRMYQTGVTLVGWDSGRFDVVNTKKFDYIISMDGDKDHTIKYPHGNKNALKGKQDICISGIECGYSENGYSIYLREKKESK